jgi:hypothetical protein
MPTPTTSPDIREVILTAIADQQRKAQSGGATLQQGTVLQAVQQSMKLQYGNVELEQLVLTEWYELFRTGFLAWGYNLTNDKAPFFHVTERGRTAFNNLSRDPNNAAGYVRYLESFTPSKRINDITMSYVKESLNCYAAGFYKSAAVMIGAAAESSILEIRDFVVEQGKQPSPAALKDYRIKTVTDALGKLFSDRIDKKTHRELREQFDAHWGGLAHEIRTTRNDAGHPTSIEPVTPESVHASLLMFPILANLCGDLLLWVSEEIHEGRV